MSERREFRELVDPAVARESIASLPIDPGTEEVSLEHARGRVLADRIDASIDVPGFDRATVDGYAVRSSDVVGADEGSPVVLENVGEIHAGEPAEIRVDAGETIEISTGAVLPPGADAVVMVERTRDGPDGIAVETAVAPGENIMTAGADVAAGNRALGPGRHLTARDIAMLAALGDETVTVHRRPRVGIVSTGDELVRPGQSLDHGRGQVHDVNSHTLVAAIEAAGGEPILYPHVSDDQDEMKETLEDAADECDLVCSSGSTSASAVDVIYRVIEARGELIHHGIAVKPGKPMLIGTIGEKAAYIGLPGFPVSALMTFRHFVAPRIRSAAGLGHDDPARLVATMAAEARFAEGRLRLLPVGIVEGEDGIPLVYPVDKGSGATTSLAHADGVVEVPADTAFVSAGEDVTVNLFDADVRPPGLLAVGEDDPTFGDLLDHVASPRFLPVGSIEGARRFDRAIPDIAVLAGSTAPDTEGIVLGEWYRDWGIVLPSGNPEGIDDLADLLESGSQFASLGSSALRTVFDDALSAAAEERGYSSGELAALLPGSLMGRPGHESPARRVLAGTVDAGLGLEQTARSLGLAYRSCGEQLVQVHCRTERTEKTGVGELKQAIEQVLPEIIDETPGVRQAGPDQSSAAEATDEP